jgi:Predicted hydrolases of HD superfamily
MNDMKLEKQIRFIVEIDKLKQVYRKTKILDRTRYENDAEHSWHLAMMAIILAEYANDRSVDIYKVLKLLLIHDLVEIDAGDTYAYDSTGQSSKKEREIKAAQRLFSLLPEDQGLELMSLWEEYDLHNTMEARFASALDKLQPLLFNHLNDGEIWKENNITSNMVIERNERIALGSESLWEYAQRIINTSIEQGILESSTEKRDQPDK